MPTAVSTITYATHDGVALVADLYRPAGDALAPVCLCVHGGAWQRGTRTSYRYLGPLLAEAGYAVVAIDYRLVAGSANRYPAAVDDVRAALAYVRAHATAFGGDAERIVLLGDSAGGHLATLVGLTTDEPIAAVVGVYGVYDLAAQWEADLAGHIDEANIGHKFLGVPLVENRRIFFEASPINHVLRAKNHIPFFLAWGTNDDIVLPEQSERMLQALKLAGFYVRTTVQAAPHYWISDPIDEPGSYSRFFAFRLLRFLRDRVPPKS